MMQHGDPAEAREYMRGVNEGIAAMQVLYGPAVAGELSGDGPFDAAVAAMIAAFEAGDFGELEQEERTLNEQSRRDGRHWVRGVYRCAQAPELGPVYVVRSLAGFPSTLVMLASEY